MTRELPPPELLRKLLRYEPGTGRLFWRPRPVEMFSSQGAAKSWNAKWAGKEAFTSTNSLGYRRGCIFGVAHKAHRVIWAIETGSWPEDDIDHEEGNTADNRFAKLRDATRTENNRNASRRADNKSGVTGVYWEKAVGKWCARIRVDGRQRYLGVFIDFDTAVAARQAAEVEHGFHKNHGRSAA